jgi:hypothetical protein
MKTSLCSDPLSAYVTGAAGRVAIETTRARPASQLHDLGITLIERQTLDSALMSAPSVLEALGWERHQAHTGWSGDPEPRRKPRA